MSHVAPRYRQHVERGYQSDCEQRFRARPKHGRLYNSTRSSRLPLYENMYYESSGASVPQALCNKAASSQDVTKIREQHVKRLQWADNFIQEAETSRRKERVPMATSAEIVRCFITSRHKPPLHKRITTSSDHEHTKNDIELDQSRNSLPMDMKKDFELPPTCTSTQLNKFFNKNCQNKNKNDTVNTTHTKLHNLLSASNMVKDYKRQEKNPPKGIYRDLNVYHNMRDTSSKLERNNFGGNIKKPNLNSQLLHHHQYNNLIENKSGVFNSASYNNSSNLIRSKSTSHLSNTSVANPRKDWRNMTLPIKENSNPMGCRIPSSENKSILRGTSGIDKHKHSGIHTLDNNHTPFHLIKHTESFELPLCRGKRPTVSFEDDKYVDFQQNKNQYATDCNKDHNSYVQNERNNNLHELSNRLDGGEVINQSSQNLVNSQQITYNQDLEAALTESNIQCPANIPMRVLKHHVPDTSCRNVHGASVMLEVDEKLVVNALYKIKNLVFVRTPDNREGYVPYSHLGPVCLNWNHCCRLCRKTYKEFGQQFPEVDVEQITIEVTNSSMDKFKRANKLLSQNNNPYRFEDMKSSLVLEPKSKLCEIAEDWREQISSYENQQSIFYCSQENLATKSSPRNESISDASLSHDTAYSSDDTLPHETKDESILSSYNKKKTPSSKLDMNKYITNSKDTNTSHEDSISVNNINSSNMSQYSTDSFLENSISKLIGTIKSNELESDMEEVTIDITNQQVTNKADSECLKQKSQILLTVLFDYVAKNATDISVKHQEIVTLLNDKNVNWVWVRKENGEEGFIPRNFTVHLPSLNLDPSAKTTYL